MNHRKPHLSRSALGCLIAILLVGCGLALAQRENARLDEREFVLQFAEGAPLLVGASVHLAFSDRGLSADAGCNHLFGKYTVEGQRLVVVGVTQTEMGCEHLDEQRDEWFSQLLVSRPSVNLAGSTLTITGNGTRLVFLDRVVADPDRSLTATRWEVDSYVDGDTAMGLMGITRPSLTFASDGTWSLEATCTTARGRYRVTGAELTLREATFIDRGAACLDENDREAASFVKSVLVEGKLDYHIEARRLALKGTPRSLYLQAQQ